MGLPVTEDFKHWKRAFNRFYKEKKKNSKVCLIISWADYTSGYWIEVYDPITSRGEDQKVYRSVKEVQALEKRISDALAVNPNCRKIIL